MIKIDNKIVNFSDGVKILFVRYFFEKNKQELTGLFGNEAFNKSEKIALYFRNNDIAGLVAYTVKDAQAGKAADLLIDFVVAKYRDLAVGKHFFIDDLSFWKRQGVNAFAVEHPAEAHIRYLERLGFTCSDNSGTWAKSLNN